ncbi:TonB-dependent receptor [Sphingobium sp. H39-3-25]|uniref:TonB-dependent receptor plug domain-containing protein n=1 Tax=Sphingobium arseniciresistens TaxID=3030834 RepID=UPI0023B9BE56|nr:TonB-dependent receptor [Sphingobium arseniciresistens]
MNSVDSTVMSGRRASRRSSRGAASRILLFATTATFPYFPVLAQSAAAPVAPVQTATGQNEAVEVAGQSTSDPAADIVVTATRIVREGYQAPTPLSVIGAERLASSANSNLAQFVSTLPAFVGSGNTRSGLASGGAGTTGINSISLRGLGSNRTLILFDGHRTTPAHPNGDIDINLIPQQLVSRVDVVTGGASAVYGSDAVAGVVNFIIDKKYTGIKGEASGGITTYGDGRNYKIALAGGWDFADGRGHILLSGEHVDDKGIDGHSKRKWTRDNAQTFINPAYTATNGQPQYLVLNNTGYTNGSPGGVIVNGPLRGTAFGQGGVPFQLVYGDIVGDVYMRGGDYEKTGVRQFAWIAPKESRQSAFGRAAYDLADNVTIYAQYAWNRTETFSGIIPAFLLNTTGPLISIENPYIPDSVRAQMIARGLTSIRIGTTNADSHVIDTRTVRTGQSFELGTEGAFDALGSKWKFDVYAQRGRTHAKLTTPNNLSRANYALAVDAVRNPANGAIVCRSTLTNPNNGCSPYNVMGIGVNDFDGPGRRFISVESFQDLKLEQDVYAASITGEPFSAPAGPVSIALSAEHRRNSAASTVDRGSLAADHILGNYGAIQGETKVTEGALETVIPIFKGQPWAESLDFNGAVRFTRYSRAGSVTTWKLGLVYTPIDDIRIRATRSRDIRAPNLLETFSPAVTTRATVFDPFTNSSTTFNQTTTGNLDLRPEVADNTSIGAVIQPSFIPGLSFSADLWDIKIKEAISSINPAQTLLLCFDGTAPELCANIARTNGVLTAVTSRSINFALLQARGIDFEGSYTMPLNAIFGNAPGTFSLHGNATIYLKQYVNSRVSAPADFVGENGAGNPPKWRGTATATYRVQPFVTSLTVRAFPGGTINNIAIACTSNCPTSTTARPTYSQNHLPGRAYLDAAFSYDIGLGGKRGGTLFLNIRNLLNSAPGAPRVSGNALQNGANSLLYDVDGRTFRAGFRFNL